MPSRRRRKRRRGAGVNATKSDIQTHLDKIPGAECVQDYVSDLSSKEFNKLMKTYVKPLQKGGRRRTRKRRGGQPGAQLLLHLGRNIKSRANTPSRNTPECGRCLHVCRCGNANRSPECRQCVSGRSMKSSSGTRRRARDGNRGIQRRKTQDNVPELVPPPRQEGPRAREDSRFDRCSGAKALCSARGSKSTACKQEKVCNDAIMAEIKRLAKETLDAGGEGAGGESWRGQGRRERHTVTKDIPPEVREASSFAQGLLEGIPDSVRNQAPGVLLGIIATMIASYLWKKCRRRRGAGGNGGSSGGRTVYPHDAHEAGSSVATPSTVGPMVGENNASSGASAATMGGRRRSRRRRSRRRRRTRRRRRRRRR